MYRSNVLRFDFRCEAPTSTDHFEGLTLLQEAPKKRIFVGGGCVFIFFNDGESRAELLVVDSRPGLETMQEVLEVIEDSAPRDDSSGQLQISVPATTRALGHFHPKCIMPFASKLPHGTGGNVLKDVADLLRALDYWKELRSTIRLLVAAGHHVPGDKRPLQLTELARVFVSDDWWDAAKRCIGASHAVYPGYGPFHWLDFQALRGTQEGDRCMFALEAKDKKEGARQPRLQVGLSDHELSLAISSVQTSQAFELLHARVEIERLLALSSSRRRSR